MMRIGHGYDVHRLVADRQLVIGGVTIDHEFGLLGHSDADVLLHAICDALLGAIGAGDIGRHFPDSDPAFKGIDSRQLLTHVVALVTESGYRIGNIDSTILAQQPKMAPHIGQMISNIAADCSVAPGRVNVKATTTEELGFVGRSEGIAAHAIVLLQRADDSDHI